MSTDKNTPPLSAAHQNIAEIAARNLSALAEGNGFSGETLRLTRQDVTLHSLRGAVVVDVIPEISHHLVKGRQPRGQVLGSQTAVTGEARADAEKFLQAEAVRRDIERALDKKPGHGFGAEAFKLKLSQTPKEYSVIDRCNACQGNGTVSCHVCHRSGRQPCVRCHGQGQLQRDDGSYAPCPGCNGQRTLPCTVCHGQGQGPCMECDRSGYNTHVYQAQWFAEVSFSLDRSGVHPHALKAVDELGVAALANHGHADVSRAAAEIRQHKLAFPFTALLPVAAAEFSIQGKTWPAVIAGLRGHVLEIGAFLDTLVKPGINALFKLSKRPMTSAALMETACKYRLVRETLSGLAHQSRKTVYQKLLRDYPRVLSDTYAKAAVKYGNDALLSLSVGPRRKGLVMGTLFAALPVTAAWFATDARLWTAGFLQQRGLGQHIIGADIGIYVLAYALCILIIKMVTAAGLRQILPPSVHDNVQRPGHGLPPAGEMAWLALVTTLAVFIVAAYFAPVAPEWMARIRDFKN